VSETELSENPLISNEKLKQIYRAMIQTRLFGECLVRMQRKTKTSAKRASIFGEEACRVSTLIELMAGDLICDAISNPVTELILGIPARSLLRRARSISLPTAASRLALDKEHAPRLLPPIAETRERLELAMGAALALKLLQPGRIVVVYVYRHEIGGNIWKKTLVLARKLELPIIFVVLAKVSDKKSSSIRVCDKARSAGVPAIPVDSRDAVALFRVVQESLGRTRGGDGPVLIECLSYSLSKTMTAPRDPIAQTGKFLLERKVCNQRWLDSTERSFRKQLGRWKE
jgi:TPP-dependent pyruvate/acetoin dehydrogenase alpha subunit